MNNKHVLIQDPFIAVAQIVLPRRVVWQTRHLISRAVLEDPTHRAVVLASGGNPNASRDQWNAEDAWENEGGAQAYA